MSRDKREERLSHLLKQDSDTSTWFDCAQTATAVPRSGMLASTDDKNRDPDGKRWGCQCRDRKRAQGHDVKGREGHRTSRAVFVLVYLNWGLIDSLKCLLLLTER